MSPPKARLALAIPGSGPDPAPVGIAMLAALAGRGLRVQHFRAWACPVGTRAVGALTGLPGRHLDAWLMPPEVCRSAFARGACSADLAVVEGTAEEVQTPPGRPPADYEDSCLSSIGRPGALLPLAEALDTPIVAAVPCDRLDRFHLPHLPRGVDAVILDGLERRCEYAAMRRMVELVLDRPVLGALEALPDARRALREARRDQELDPELASCLGASLARCSDLGTLLGLAASRPPLPADSAALPPTGPRFKVAYAHDEAFGDYFPDTLETFEALGAELVEFSPLSDGDLPPGVDLVMIGCGFPDRFAEELAANACLTSALRSWVCRGRPLYAEGGGCAYLGRFMRLGDRDVPGVGLFPFDAVLLADPEPPAPVSRRLIHCCPLGGVGTTLRGYHSNRWALRPAPEPGDCPASSGFLTAERDLAYRRNAVGSLIHLHLASLPQVVSCFAGLGRRNLASPTSPGR